MISFEASEFCFPLTSIQKLRNSYIEAKQRATLLKMENDVMGEKL